MNDDELADLIIKVDQTKVLEEMMKESQKKQEELDKTLKAIGFSDYVKPGPKPNLKPKIKPPPTKSMEESLSESMAKEINKEIDSNISKKLKEKYGPPSKFNEEYYGQEHYGEFPYEEFPYEEFPLNLSTSSSQFNELLSIGKTFKYFTENIIFHMLNIIDLYIKLNVVVNKDIIKIKTNIEYIRNMDFDSEIPVGFLVEEMEQLSKIMKVKLNADIKNSEYEFIDI